MYAIGIDLGTTNSLVACLKDGKPTLIPNSLGGLLTPSVVGIDDDDILITGEAAKHRLISHPDRTNSLFKRRIGTEGVTYLGKKPFRAEELSALILRSLKADAEAYLDGPIGTVVVSVPAYFNEVQRRAVRNACHLAGLDVDRLINEPTAAALAYGLHERDLEKTFLVFDLGGGTFDVSILELFDGVMEVRSTAGDAFVGGEDFTEALANHLHSKAGAAPLSPEHKAIMRRAAEGAKLQLTKAEEAHVTLAANDPPSEITVTRGAFEEMVAPLLKRLIRPVSRALNDARIAPPNLDRVVLVGGATRMPVIRSLIARQLQKFPETILDPDHVVALGAAVQAGLVARDAGLADMVMTDVSAFTLGVETTHQNGRYYQGGHFLPIIERNSTVPISREQIVSTLQIGQKNIDVLVYQGEAPMVADNIRLGELSLAVPHNRKEHEHISIRFTYDVSGLLEIEATSLSSGQKNRIVIGTSGLEMTNIEIEKRLLDLAALKVHPRDHAQNMLIQARLGEAYAMALGEERQYLQSELAGFQMLLESQDIPAIESKRKEIAAMIDAFENNYVR